MTLFVLAITLSPPLQSQEGGFSSFLDGSGLHDPEKLYRLDGNSSVGDLVLHNYESKPLPISLVFLIDYRQTEFIVDKKKKTSLDITLPSGIDQHFDLELPNCSPGIHDALILIFFLPGLYPDNPEFLEDSRDFYHTHRFRLDCGGDTTKPSYDLEATGEHDQEAEKGIQMLALTSSTDPDEAWYTTGKNQKDFYVHINNVDKTQLDVALLSFLDFDQQPFDEERLTSYVRLNPLSKTVIKGSIPDYSLDTPHQFLVIMAENPYMKLSSRKPMEIYSSQRVLLVNH
jgi:hypothetical protein